MRREEGYGDVQSVVLHVAEEGEGVRRSAVWKHERLAVRRAKRCNA
jgi:hypothetical protein